MSGFQNFSKECMKYLYYASIAKPNKRCWEPNRRPLTQQK